MRGTDLFLRSSLATRCKSLTYLSLALHICLPAMPAHSYVDRVIVESSTVAAGESFGVGVFLENSTNLAAIDVPLVIRTVSGDAFITQLIPNADVAGSRVNGVLTYNITGKTYGYENGTQCKNNQPGGFGGPGNDADFLSPDAVLLLRFGFGTVLPPGTDLGATPSFELYITANGNSGTFEIDTTCIDPTNHLEFVDELGQPYTPTFQKGIVTVQALQALWPDCGCTYSPNNINSAFGPRRQSSGNPRDYHPGIDIALSPTQPVYASLDGTVNGLKEEFDRQGNSIGWYVKTKSYGLDEYGISQPLELLYHHMQANVTVALYDPVSRGQVIGYCGSYAHVHFETRRFFKRDRPAHPLRHLSHSQTVCPEIGPDIIWGPDIGGGKDYVIVESVSLIDDKYDLVGINVYLYHPQSPPRVATINFENWEQMKPEDGAFSFDFWVNDPEIKTTITLTPHNLDGGDPYHGIDIKIDPFLQPIPDANWVGVTLDDVGGKDYYYSNSQLSAQATGSKTLCTYESVWGNVSGETPGLAFDFFDAERNDGELTEIKLCWQGSAQSAATGAVLFRAIDDGSLERLNSVPLPFRADTESDTVTYVDFIPSIDAAVEYELAAFYDNGIVQMAGERLRLEPRVSSAATVPKTYSIGQNFPNPFNSTTQFRVMIDENSAEAPVSVTVYDVLGRRVATPWSLEAPHTGRYIFTWDALTSGGEELPSGVYFYKLKTRAGEESRKMVLLK